MGIEQVGADAAQMWATAQVWIQIAIPLGIAGFLGFLFMASRPGR